MNGEEKTITIAIIAIAACLMTSFVGCTITNLPEDRTSLLKACVAAGLEWKDGFCGKVKQKGGVE